MSLPIPTSMLVQGAASIASDVVQRVGDAIGFAEILAAPDSSSEVGPEHSRTLVEELVEAIQARLRKSGVSLNQDLQLGVQSSTSGDVALQVSGGHQDAEKIESILTSDKKIMELAARLAPSARTTSNVIGLTIPGGGETILPASGGYPNW